MWFVLVDQKMIFIFKCLNLNFSTADPGNVKNHKCAFSIAIELKVLVFSSSLLKYI
jgi:hypothetical protein